MSLGIKVKPRALGTKVAKRPDLGTATIKRLLVKRTKGIRVGNEAAAEARKAVRRYLFEAGKQAKTSVELAKKKTLQPNFIKNTLHLEYFGIGDNELIIGTNTRNIGDKGLSRAGVARILRSASGLRVSKKTISIATSAAEAFIESLGSKASIVAKQAKRCTIKNSDIRTIIILFFPS